MQSVSQATEIVSFVTGTPRGRANQIARSLIDAGILPRSSGRDIKKIDAAQLLPLLAAVAMAEKVADAPKVASDFATLPLGGSPDDEDNILPRFFAKVLNPNGPWRKASIEFAKLATGFVATIEGEIEDKDGRRFEMPVPFWRTASWGGFCKSSFLISADGFENMRNLFSRDDIEGINFALGPIGETA